MLGFASMILILHVNYYRLHRKQRQYFFFGITALALAVLLVLIAIKMFGTLESVSMAILLSFFAWYVINEMSLKSVTGESSGNTWKGPMVMGCYFAGFWITSLLSIWLLAQMLIYAGLFLIISLGFFRTDFNALLRIIQRSSDKRG
jgi:hypothetical protein